MRSDKKHIILRAMHEKRAIEDGTCNPLNLNDRLLNIDFHSEKKCHYALGSIAGIYLCEKANSMPSTETTHGHEHINYCKYQKKEGFETICKRYMK